LVAFVFGLQHNIIKLLVLLYVYIVTPSTEATYHVGCTQNAFRSFSILRGQKHKRSRQRHSFSAMLDSWLRLIVKYTESTLDYLQATLGRNKRRSSSGRRSCFSIRRRSSKSSRLVTWLHKPNVQRKYVRKLVAQRRFYRQSSSDDSRQTPRHCTKQNGHKTQCGNMTEKAVTTKKKKTKTFVLSTEQERTSTRLFFDTDSFEIKLDTGCSYSLSGSEADFIAGTIVPAVGMSVGAYGGTKLSVTGIGTIKWTICDDSGKLIDLVIPNSLYIKGSTTRLLSPQHYAQVGKVPDSEERVQFSTIVLLCSV
jgi:hypothetical protein